MGVKRVNILTAYSKAFDKLYDWIASKLKRLVKSNVKAAEEAEDRQKKFDRLCELWSEIDR